MTGRWARVLQARRIAEDWRDRQFPPDRVLAEIRRMADDPATYLHVTPYVLTEAKRLGLLRGLRV